MSALILHAPRDTRPVPVIVVERGRWRSLVARFQSFNGVRLQRVWNGDLYEGEIAERLWAFRQDPMSLYPPVEANKDA